MVGSRLMEHTECQWQWWEQRTRHLLVAPSLVQHTQTPRHIHVTEDMGVSVGTHYAVFDARSATGVNMKRRFFMLTPATFKQLPDVVTRDQVLKASDFVLECTEDVVGVDAVLPTEVAGERTAITQRSV